MSQISPPKIKVDKDVFGEYFKFIFERSNECLPLYKNVPNLLLKPPNGLFSQKIKRREYERKEQASPEETLQWRSKQIEVHYR